MRPPTIRRRFCRAIYAAGPQPNAPLHRPPNELVRLPGGTMPSSKEIAMQDERVALVTGANQRVGLQVAKELVANGLTVRVGSRNFERGEAATKEIGQGAIALQLDVTDRVSIAAAAERVRKEFGRLDLLVNN